MKLEYKKNSLQLTAIYGFVIAIRYRYMLTQENLIAISYNWSLLCIVIPYPIHSVILFGPLVGNWIDKTRRITAAKTFLIVNNITMAACSTMLRYFSTFYQQINLPALKSYQYQTSSK